MMMRRMTIMKTKELIKQLQEADPTGETECCVDNKDIFFVDCEPSYWDGCLQILKRDHTSKHYNVIGARYTTKGHKISIVTLSIEDAISEDPDLSIEYEGFFDGCKTMERYQEAVKKWRKRTIRINKKVEKWSQERKKDNE